MKCRIEISARHIHLTKEDCLTLFGKDSLEIVKKLSQEEEFAAKESVKLVGPKNFLSGVRVVGPFRQQSQAEISFTDARFLDIKAPLKVSGDLPGAEIEVIGPKGSIKKEIAIVAKRHLHLSTKEAIELKLNHRDNVKVKILGERALIFDQVVVRVRDDYNLSVQLDTDEANAAGLFSESEGELILD